MLYQIQKRDIDKAAEILGQSFINYPIFKYILPDDQYRKTNISLLFKFLLKMGMLNGEVIAPSNKIEGVSIWVHSSCTNTSLINVLRAGYITLLFNIDLDSIKRFTEIGMKKQKIRSKILNEPYYLLDVVGVNPQFQRNGFARFMIQSKLADFDKQSIPCYLETSNKANLDIYKRYGFNLLHQYELNNIDVFCLIRQSGKTKY